MDDRLAIHISEWMKGLQVPCDVELRYRKDVIDSIRLTDDKDDHEALATELLEAASADALSQGKSCNYAVVAIVTATSERYPCPIQIRRRVDKTAHDLVATMASHNRDLIEELRRTRKDNTTLLLQLAETLSQQNRDLVRENNEHRGRASEVIDKLEALRSKQLERDLEKEKFEADKDIKQQITSAAVPLMLAVGNRFTNGMIPAAKDMRELMLSEVIKGMTESQVDIMLATVGPEHAEELRSLMADVLDGKPGVRSFMQLKDKLDQETLMKLVMVLNVGQQAAMKELLDATTSN